MEPFTMMLGYGLVNSLSQLVIRPLADRLSASSRQREISAQMESKHTLDIEALRLNKLIEKENQLDIQAYCHKCRVEEAQQQFERQLKMWQIGQFNDKMWPLLTPFDHPSLHPNFAPGIRVPINVFLAQTDPKSPFALLVQPELKNRLSSFLQTAYAADPMQEHPTVCRIGDWKNGFQDAAFINALWFGMQGQPSIVVNPIQTSFGENLDLNISIWGLGESGTSPATRNVMSGNFGRVLGSLKRQESKTWIDHGLPVSSPEMEHNRQLLEQETAMTNAGHGEYVGELLSQYLLPREVQSRVIGKFSSHYTQAIACLTALFADIYHLVEYGAQPYMPAALTQQQMPIPDTAAAYYRHTLTAMACTDYLQDKLQWAYLGVARALKYDPANATQVFGEAVALWANRKRNDDTTIDIPQSLDEALKLLGEQATATDSDFLADAAQTLRTLAQQDAATEVEGDIKRLEQTIATQPADSHKEAGQNTEATLAQCKEHSNASGTAHTEATQPQTDESNKENAEHPTDDTAAVKALVKKYYEHNAGKYAVDGIWRVETNSIGYRDGNLYSALHGNSWDHKHLNVVVVRQPRYFAGFFVDKDANIVSTKQWGTIYGGMAIITDKYIYPEHDGYGIICVHDPYYDQNDKDIPLNEFKQRKGYRKLTDEVIPQIDAMMSNILEDISHGDEFNHRDYKLGYQSRIKLLDEPLIMKKTDTAWKMFMLGNISDMGSNLQSHLAYECKEALDKDNYSQYTKLMDHGAGYDITIERNNYMATLFAKEDGSFFEGKGFDVNRCFLRMPGDGQYYEEHADVETAYRALHITKQTYPDHTEVAAADNVTLKRDSLPHLYDLELNILRLDALCALQWNKAKKSRTAEGKMTSLDKLK